MHAISRFVVFIGWVVALFPSVSHALPTVGATLTSASSTALVLTFDSAATAAANTASNYTLSGTGGLTGNPTLAVLNASGTSVTLTVPTMATLTHGATVIVTVSNTVADAAGNLVATYTVDAIPSTFSFTGIANALTATAYESEAITISDINTTLTLGTTSGSNSTLTCAKFTHGGTAWGSFGTCTSVTVGSGDLVKVKLTSASTYSTAVAGGITIGGISATFTVTTFSAATAAPVPIPSNVTITELSSLGSALDSPPSGLYISSNGAMVIPASVSGTLTLLPTAAEGTAFWILNGGTASFALGGASLTITPGDSGNVLAILKYLTVDDYTDLQVLEIVKGRAVVSGALGVAPIASIRLGTGTSTTQLVVLPIGSTAPITDIKINSDGTGMLAVTAGSLSLRAASSSSTVTSTDTSTTLYSNEVASLASTAALTSIRVGSLDDDGTGVGDPMTFTSNALITNDIDRQAKIPRLGNSLARINNTDTLLEALFDTIGLRSNLARGGQTTKGVVPLLIDGIAYYFTPIGDVTVDTTRTNGVELNSSGVFEITRSGVMAKFRPSLFDTQGFAINMLTSTGASIDLNTAGALEISQNGETLMMMPEMFTQSIAGTANGVSYDENGFLTYAKNGEVQRLLPHFYDMQQLASTFASLADSIALQDNMDGTVSATLTVTETIDGQETEQTSTYVLVPAYRVLSPLTIPIAHRGDSWWVGDDGLIYINYSNGSAQGFSIR